MNSSRESTNLDLLRSVAVSLVVLSHVIPRHGRETFDWRALGLLGVLIFFVHTSLVLMMSLERLTSRFGTRGSYVGFELRRVFRLYPLSVVIVLLHFFLGANGLAPPVSTTATDLWANLALVQNIARVPSIPTSLWSLAYEVQMYLVLPLLFALVNRASRGKEQAGLPGGTWAMGALWGAAVAIILGLSRLDWDYQLIKYVPCFIPGVLAYSLRARTPRLPAAVLFAFVFVMAIAVPLWVGGGYPETPIGWPVCLALGCLIPFVREVQSRRLALLGKTVAKYSYGVYLTHLWAIWFAFDALHSQPAAVSWVAFAASLLALSWLAYHAIERPMMMLGARLSERYVAQRKYTATSDAALRTGSK